MEEILIDDGSKEYCFKNLNGEVFAQFRFNPADAGLLERYNQIVEFFQAVEYSEKITAEDIVNLGNKIKNQFDVLCGTDVSSGLFMRYSPLTPMASGDLYCEIALEKIGTFIEKELNVRLKMKTAKIKKDIAKNHE